MAVSQIRTSSSRGDSSRPIATWSRRHLLRRAASLGAGGAVGIGLAAGNGGPPGRAQVTPAASPAASPVAGRLPLRGVTYMTGIEWAPGEPSRPIWEPAFVAADLAAIHDDLHCNTVTLSGSDPGQLLEAAGLANEAGLAVWLQPWLVDGSPAAKLAQIAEVAAGAAALAARGQETVLSFGSELSIFMSGIIPGATYLDRLTTLTTDFSDLPVYNRALNDYLAEAVATARESFAGPLSYAAGFWEQVDWTGFDIIGANLYRDANNAASYDELLAGVVAQAKPVVITEFGCCAFAGAEDYGGAGFMIVDWTTTPPSIKGDITRSEQTQADEIIDLLTRFTHAGAHGAFIFTFIQPEYPYSPDPKFDLDLASFGIVRAYPATADNGYLTTGYWEPKEAFAAVADFYGALDQAE